MLNTIRRSGTNKHKKYMALLAEFRYLDWLRRNKAMFVD